MSLFKKPTFYITNDVERALWPGWETDPNYHIVTYNNPYSAWLANQGKSKHSFFLVDGPKGSTEELMKKKEVIEHVQDIQAKDKKQKDLSSSSFIEDPNNKNKKQKDLKSFGVSFGSLDSRSKSGMTVPLIIVFKPTVEIEEWCKKMGWRLLNSSSRFGEQFEEKIAQSGLFKRLELQTPKTIVTTIGEIGSSTVKNIGFPFILQFNLGHTGEGTYLMRQESDLKQFQKFPKRPVRITEYIEGIPLTVNAIVGKKVYVSSPSLQITGIKELTPLPFATVGNDWSYASSKFKVQSSKLRSIVMRVGSELKRQGYRGAFGVDLVWGDNKKLYVIETNIRQVNSCVYESYLQVQSSKFKVQDRGVPSGRFHKEFQASSFKLQETTMSLYFKCLLGLDTGSERLPQSLEGAQIFVRAQEDARWRTIISPKTTQQRLFIFSKLSKSDVVKKNAEILRIQSKEGMVNRAMRVQSAILRLVKTLV